MEQKMAKGTRQKHSSAFNAKVALTRQAWVGRPLNGR